MQLKAIQKIRLLTLKEAVCEKFGIPSTGEYLMLSRFTTVGHNCRSVGKRLIQTKLVMHQSVPSANISPPGQPPEFCTYFQPGSRGFVPSELPGGRTSIIKVPCCQLMPHESTFQLQIDLPSSLLNGECKRGWRG